MKNFNATSICEKCFGKEARVHYCSGEVLIGGTAAIRPGEESSFWKNDGCEKEKEHLHKKCETCGYCWTEKTAASGKGNGNE